MNILVTGGCGFIGSNFINYILHKNNAVKIFNIDCLNYCANEKNIDKNPNYKFNFLFLSLTFQIKKLTTFF